MKISPLLRFITIFIVNHTVKMADYLHYFNTNAEFNNAMKNNYSEPWVSCITGSSVQYNFPKYVDLGLPSGNLWFSMDVGATAPYVRGTLYRWGEITPFVSGTTYIYGSTTPYSKYNNTDKIIFLESEDDIIQVSSENIPIPNGYYPTMPSASDFQELVQGTSRSADKQNDLTIFTSRTNGNTLIIPGNGTTVAIAGQPYFFLWSNEVNTAYTNRQYAYALYTYADSGSFYYGVGSTMNRTAQAAVRGVLKKSSK